MIITESCQHEKIKIAKDFQKLHLKKQLDFSFVNNYFDTGLKAWQENMEKQPVLNQYKQVTYVYMSI